MNKPSKEAIHQLLVYLKKTSVPRILADKKKKEVS